MWRLNLLMGIEDWTTYSNSSLVGGADNVGTVGQYQDFSILVDMESKCSRNFFVNYRST